ncbi:uncharacterized protein LOC120528598 [Polypterus senegalus]|uniref:uncharacterized protein LOC120528598 n=1 Tax=Polypterus senegalus TaxID=55291 RepID=UPI0019657D69|nr:uncharacterized protein LOC120528598 [Polypterus senegalus]XP_039608709.1 uncharacterized protein LOC120528598 [Polypterus senegalus]XP_039608710.1 uncharacterized protein LOC120528598 [Polypterus senegalus]
MDFKVSERKKSSQEPKTIENYMNGKLLRKEVAEQYGTFSAEKIKEFEKELTKGGNRDASAASPKQRLIDDLLARRKIAQFDKEMNKVSDERKLKRRKDFVMNDLRALQLEAGHHEFIVPLKQLEEEQELWARIQQQLESLPAMEAKVNNMRKLLEMQDKSEGMEPNSLKTVHQLLGEIVEEVTDDNPHMPEARDHFTMFSWNQKQPIDRVLQEEQTNRIFNLIMEQIILECTLDLSKEIVQELYNVEKMCRALSFEVILNSAKEAAKVKHSTGTVYTSVSLEELSQLLLQQQLNRHQHREEIWDHMEKKVQK